jgi:hypothetical protein
LVAGDHIEAPLLPVLINVEDGEGERGLGGLGVASKDLSLLALLEALDPRERQGSCLATL